MSTILNKKIEIIVRIFILQSFFVCGYAHSQKIIFMEYEKANQLWRMYSASIDKEISGKKKIDLDDDFGYINHDLTWIYYYGNKEGINKVNKNFKIKTEILSGSYLKKLYGKDYFQMKYFDKPYVNVKDDIVILSAYKNKTNSMHIYRIDYRYKKEKEIYKFVQRKPFYPIKFGNNNDVYVVNGESIERIGLDTGEKKVFYKTSCVIYDFDVSKDRNIITYSCLDRKTMNKDLYVFNKFEKKLSVICKKCLEHGLSDQGNKVLYSTADENGGEKLFEFDLVSMNKRVVYSSDTSLSNIIYLQ